MKESVSSEFTTPATLTYIKGSRVVHAYIGEWRKYIWSCMTQQIPINNSKFSTPAITFHNKYMQKEGEAA